jgi:betaine lipid synthase
MFKHFYRPYYIWLGCSRARDISATCHVFEVEGGNLVGNFSPKFSPVASPSANSEKVPELIMPTSLIPAEKTGAPVPETIIDVMPPLR